uniref:Protein kinase domain-containing protein n=1 Tax=Arcella intermedia TaxID=1963864 RepID=A0A6B2L6G2_9EUKA
MQALIGTGKFGKVVKARERATGKVVAIKIIKKKDVQEGQDLQHTIAERNILMRINHPFLMRLHSAFQTTEKLVLVMDFVNGGELFYHLVHHPERKFDNERTKFYAAEICLGIEHLHLMGIIYRDLKPENVLIDCEGHIRLTDFGLSKEGLFKNDRTSTFCGTPEYLAPEVLLGTKYSNAVDWWGFGALIFEMLTGTAPFFEQDIKKMFQMKITCKIGFPDYVEETAKHLLIRLLDRNPGTRWTDPKKIKAHPWFSTIDWDKLYKKELQPPFKPVLDSPDSLIFIDKSFTNKDVDQEIGSTNEPGIEDQEDPKFSSFNYFPDSPSSFSDKAITHRHDGVGLGDSGPPVLRRTSTSLNLNQDVKRRVSYYREMVTKDLFPPLKIEDDIVF